MDHICLQNSKVIDSRGASKGTQVRRRRECLKCGRRFSTREADVDVIVTEDEHYTFVKECKKLFDQIDRLREKVKGM